MPVHSGWLFPNIMQQLSLIDLPSEQLDLKEAYQALLSPRLTFKAILASALVIEKELDNRAIYQELGFSDIRKFLESIPKARADEYLVSIKMIWWQRLIWTDRPVDWIKREQFKSSNFINRYAFITFNKSTRALTLQRAKKRTAQNTWELIKRIYGNDCSYAEIEKFVAYDGTYNEHIMALDAKVLQLQKDLELAKQGIVSHYGKRAKNNEIPLRYSELYCLARRTNMSALQLQCFTDIMLLEGYYPACQHLDQFELIA